MADQKEFKKIRRRAINKEKVEYIAPPITNSLPVRGRNLFSDPYSIKFLVAKKKSGKTTLAFHIMKKTIGANTKVLLFVPTFYNDASWGVISEWLDEKGIPYQVYTSMKVGKKNLLGEFLKELAEDAKNKQEKKIPLEEEPKGGFKYQSPRYLIILDDISSELKSPEFAGYLKTIRHYKSACIASSQYVKDLKPEACRQVDFWILFPKLADKDLDKIYKDAGISTIPFDIFVELYKDATKEAHNFLYINSNSHTEEFRKNFNEKYQFEKFE